MILNIKGFGVEINEEKEKEEEKAVETKPKTC